MGLRCRDGVVLAVEKLVQSKLLVPGSNKRIGTIDRHVGIVRLLPTPLSQVMDRADRLFALRPALD